MNRSVPNRNGVLFCLLSIALGFATAFGGSKAEVSKPEVPEIVKLRERVSAAARERRAEEAYEKKDIEIAPWVEDAAPPNPDNAALLYYQAFLLRPEPNMAINKKIHNILFDTGPDRQIRTYLGHCLPMMEMAEIASRIPQCTWGVWQGRELSLLSKRALDSQVSYLWQILMVDARTLAADGHYRAALERCLTLRRLARHLSEDPRLDLAARNPDFMALRTIQHVLGVMPPDADILTWFRGRLAVVKGLRLSFAQMLQAKSISFFYLMRTNPGTVSHLRNLLVERAEDEIAKEKLRNLTDDQLLLRTREGFPHLVDLIVQVADSEMTYEQKCAQMQSFINKLTEADGIDPVAKCAIFVSDTRGMIERQYPFLVGHAAHINGIKAAVEVYLVVAKTGRLPEKLPDHLPKDPFTGQDFVYEITDEGFALRCQGKEFLRRKNRFLEFKVKR